MAFIIKWNLFIGIVAFMAYVVQKIMGKRLGDAVDMRKNGGIIFRAEHNTVHLVRRQFITGHLMLEQGIAGKDIAFFKPLQQPAGVILDGVRPSSCIDNHSVFLLMD